MPTRTRNRRPTRRMPARSRALVDLGFGDRLLLSQDVFLKIMLTRYGGFGYGYILKHFVPRLKRHGARPGRSSTACWSTIPRPFSRGMKSSSQYHEE